MIHGTDTIVSIDNLLGPLKHEANMVHFAGKPKLVFVQVTTVTTTTNNNCSINDDNNYNDNNTNIFCWFLFDQPFCLELVKD